MYTKLTTPGQITQLRKGDIIKRFPYNSVDDSPRATFDESSPNNIGSYEIRSINQDGVFSLVDANVKSLAFASPVDMGRLFIKGTDLIAEKVWWIG